MNRKQFGIVKIFFSFQFGMLSSSLILTSFLKHRCILSSCIRLDDQGNNINLSGLLDLGYCFFPFFFGTEKAPRKNTAGSPVLEYAISVKSSMTQDLPSLDFSYYPSLYLIILWREVKKASLRLCNKRSS